MGVTGGSDDDEEEGMGVSVLGTLNEYVLIPLVGQRGQQKWTGSHFLHFPFLLCREENEREETGRSTQIR